MNILIRKVRRSILVAGIAFAALAPLSLAFAVPYVIYDDAAIATGGGNATSPGGDPMAYFTYSQFRNQYFGTDTTSPPQGTRFIVASVGGVAPNSNTYGGTGTAFMNAGYTAQVPKDMSSYSGGTLQFYLKSDRTLTIEIQWDNGAGGNTSSTGYNVSSTGGSWQLISIPLTSASFGASVDYTKIKVPFLIRIPSTYTTDSVYDIDYIRWVAAAPSTPVLSPGSTRVNPGKHRMFFVDQTSALSLSPSNLGSLSTTSGNVAVVTANSTIQNGTINATANSLTGTAAISVTSANIDQQYALLAAETIPTGVSLGSDSNLVTYADSLGLGSTITLTNVTNDFREGTYSVRTDVNISTTVGYAGWAIQWAGTSTDMNEFYDGSIRFWFKGDPTLSGKVKMSIRSSNVTAGSEQNIWLQNYTTFDNTWRAVVIPVSQLAGLSPQADLSQISVLFNVGLSSTTSGTKSFYIDKLRWDTRTPGALSRIAVTPGSATIPLNLKKTFLAAGYDSSGVPIDIWPTWTTSGTIGSTLSRTTGDSTQFTAPNAAGTGGLIATQVVTASATVTVTTITFTQSYNVYTDPGAGGQIGVDSSGGASSINLSNPEYQPGNAPEGLKVMHATFTVSGTGAYATWFVYEVTGSRYLTAYSQGYLHFWVRSTNDLEVSIRSANVSAATNRAKFRLSALGVPLDGTWQEVWLSLNDFAVAEPSLDFSQMVVYFAIAAVQSETGNVTNQVFDVDDVLWYTADPHVPDPAKVYLGLKNKQSATTGLVVTYDNDSTNRAVTYDQALAAMAYTYQTDTALSKKVLDVFKTKWAAAGGSFAGFNAEYDRDTPSIIRNYDRVAGPNAWIMLAAIHYRTATSSTTYDGMIGGIGAWLKTLQDTDGGIMYGFTGSGGTAATYKSTEQNFDVYTAFNAWYTISGDASYNTAANSVYAWMVSADTNTVVGGWNTPQGRFNVGKLTSGARNNDYALDVYAWAPLALNGYEGVLDQAETLFVSTHSADATGLAVTGFDFSGTPGNGSTIPYGVVPDKDAVWLEGTGQMAVAYEVAGRASKAAQYLNELDKAVYNIANGGQGLTYATNAGTAYWTGSLMDSTHAAISPMAWYLFAKWGFNPMQPLPMFNVAVRNISNDAVVSTMTWSVTVPTSGWKMASQYVQVRTQGSDSRPWGLQIYTDNTNTALPVRYVDPTPAITINSDSDPAGLMQIVPGTTTVTYKLPLAWRIVDSTATVPPVARPYSLNLGPESPDSYSWFYFKDKKTPAIDNNGNGNTTDPGDGTAFTPGETYITVKNNTGIQATGNTFNAAYSPDFIYLEADFSTAAAKVIYSANIIMEFYIQ